MYDIVHDRVCDNDYVWARLCLCVDPCCVAYWHVCSTACLCACMFVWLLVHVYAYIYAWRHGCMDCPYGYVYVLINVNMYDCMSVCMSSFVATLA